MNKLTPKEGQIYALDKIKKWFKKSSSRRDFMVLSGYAGTGKSTLLSWLQEDLGLKSTEIVFSSFTGKATHVLAQNGLRALTLHRLLYKSYLNKQTGEYHSKLKVDGLSERLIVVDEASMLSEKLFNDLMRISGKQIRLLFVGDEAQLPPIGSDFNIMKNPQIKLKKILRQAALNPIIRLSQKIRNGEEWKIEDVINEKGEGYSKLKDEDLEESVDRMFRDDVFLCSTNKDRVFFNKQIRNQLHSSKDVDMITKGDRLIILDNCSNQEVFNGQLFTVEKYKKISKHKIQIYGEGDTFDRLEVLVHPYSFLNEKSANRFDVCKKHKLDFKTMGVSCDYAYSLTVHKSQGSQFKNVVLKLTNYDKIIWKELYDRWLYTAITRASHNLYFY